MSKFHVEKVTCPECGNMLNIKVWDSINTNLNPEIKEKILAGTFYDAVCPKCKVKIHCVYGFLYHDMLHKYMISVCHDYSAAMAKFQTPEDYKFRKVKDLNHLIEKIRIFEDGYNDIVMELAKKVLKDIDKAHNEFLYCSVENGNILFALPKDPGKALQVSTDIYDASYENCTEHDLEEKEEFSVVDEQYILNLINNSKKA